MDCDVKPCPFCGGKAELRDCTEEHDGVLVFGAPFAVVCVNCGARRDDYSENDAVDGWNARVNEATK